MLGPSKNRVWDNTHSAGSSDPRVPILINELSGQEAVPGLTEGKSLLKEQEAETPGLLPPDTYTF